MRVTIRRNRHVWLRPLAVMVSTLLIAGCGGGGGSASETANATEKATITLDRTSIDFGRRVIGQTSERIIRISNGGTADLSITPTAPGQGFAVSGDCSTVHPGTTCGLVVKFSPTEQQTYEGVFAIKSNATNRNSADITLLGEGKGLTVEISSVAIDCVDSKVSAHVIVSNSNNDPVSYLGEFNFTPSVNNILVDTFDFAGIRAPEPVSVGLVIDWSGSLSPYRADLVQGSKDFVDVLRPTDSAGVYKFSVAIDQNAQDFVFTDAFGKSLLKDALDRVFSGSESATALWDAANQVVAKTAARSSPKRAIVVFTDGRDNGSSIRLADLISNAKARNVVVFTVGFGDVNAERLENLAQGTGGLYFYAPTTADFGAIYEQIASALTNQYELSFKHPVPGATQPLKIEILDPFGNSGEDSREIPKCP